jgi:hypothetical protein
MLNLLRILPDGTGVNLCRSVAIQYKRTNKMSTTSFTRPQSSSDSWKALQGIFFVMRPPARTVVIGPNMASADARKRAIGCVSIAVQF